MDAFLVLVWRGRGGKPPKTRNMPPWACFWFSRGGELADTKHASMWTHFWCWDGGEGEGSRQKPGTHPHGRAFGFRGVESQLTLKTRLRGCVFSVGIEGRR